MKSHVRMSNTLLGRARVVIFVLFAFMPTGFVAALSLEPMPPSVLMSAAPQTILTGGSSIIVWTVTSADTCVASGGWSGFKNVLGGEQPVAPLVTTTYTLTCSGPGGTSTDSITITVNPVSAVTSCTLRAVPSTISIGQSTTLTWTTDNATFVSINNGIGTVVTDGSRVVSPSTNTSYVLTATGPQGVASCSTLVTVGTAARPNLTPAAPIALASGTLRQGSDVSFTSRVKNTATHGTGIGYLNNFSYRWGNTGAWTDLTPFNSKSALAGLATALPDTSPSITLTQSGTLQVQYCADSDRRVSEEDESDNCTVYAFVVAALPASVNITFSANPRTITSGQSALLTWSVTGADTCTASDGWSGAKNPTGGNQTVSPSVTTTYTLTCTGLGGTATDSETVTVTELPQTKANLTPAVPVTLVSGSLKRNESVAFSAQVKNTSDTATEIGFHNNFTYRMNGGGWVDIVPFNSKPALAGRSLALPDVSASFVLPQSGVLELQYCVDSHRVIDEASETDNCIVNAFTVTEGAVPPQITFSANPTTITSGSSVVLTWSVTGADACIASGGWSGAKNPTGGNQTVSPSVTTTYTLTCTGLGGTATDSETVTVIAAPGGGGMTLVFRVCNVGGIGCVENGTKYVAPSTPLEVRWNATGADTCVSGNPKFTTNGNTSGTRAVTASALPNDVELFQVSCANGGTPIAKSVTVRTSAITPTLSVTPTLVRAGESVRVDWNTGNGDETACVLSGAGLQSASTLGNGTGGADTGFANVPVFSRTTFTLTCGTLSATPVTVEVRPIAFET